MTVGSQIDSLVTQVQEHAATIEQLNARIAAHEATVADISAKWAALTAAFAPKPVPAVTRPLAAIPVKQ
jgi:uncharacterized coiled-coil protein SlyX